MGEWGLFVEEATRDCGAGIRADRSAVPSILTVVVPPMACLPSLGALTRDTKLDDNVRFEPIHAGEGEWCHLAPHREGTRKGVIDHVSRQVFSVALDPGGEKPGSMGDRACRDHKWEGAGQQLHLIARSSENLQLQRLRT